MAKTNAKDSRCKQLDCRYYITPEKSGLGGGVMVRHGRCGVTQRMVHRMPGCPLGWVVPIKQIQEEKRQPAGTPADLSDREVGIPSELRCQDLSKGKTRRWPR